MQTICSCAIDYNIRDGNHFEQKPGPFVLIGRYTQQALCINDNDIGFLVISRPDTNCAGVLCRGSVEHLLSTEESVVEGVRLSISCVAKDRDDLDGRSALTLKLIN